MKKLLLTLVILLVAVGAFAQTTFTFTTFQDAFSQFATDVANSLPFNASIGLNWSDAYIGQLLDVPPHFGAGVSLGATTIPSASVTTMLGPTGLNLTLPAEVAQYIQYGVPIPAYTVEGRIGGFLLPFDIGLKVGYIPPGTLQSWGIPVDVNYLLAGADVRFALLQDSGIIPAVSVGAGYTYMRGSVSVPGLLGSGIDITNINAPGGPYAISLTDPALNFTWATNVIDLKAQVSKNLLIFTPYLGAGASYGISSAGGGVTSTLLINGSAPTQQQIDDITAYLESQGMTVDLSDQGFLIQAAANGWSFRAFGGISMNLLILKLDLTGMYNFLSGDFGASVGLRVQL
jgi:hypothetical protein